MLLHSPDLEHLNPQLCPSHNNLGSLSSLMQKTWDNLSALQIEVCPDHPARDLIAPFLAAHPLITSLSILPHVPDTLPLAFPPGTLPYLEFFGGISQHLAALPNLEHLRNLVLLDEPARNPLASTVGRLTFLTSLTITLADAGDISLVFSITSACCLLESLAISYRTPCNMVRAHHCEVHMNSPHAETVESDRCSAARAALPPRAEPHKNVPPLGRDDARRCAAPPRAEHHAAGGPPRLGQHKGVEAEWRLHDYSKEGRSSRAGCARREGVWPERTREVRGIVRPAVSARVGRQ